MDALSQTCRHCGSDHLVRYGIAPNGKQNIFVTHVANRVVQILAVMRIPQHEETKSCVHMKSAAVCAVLNEPLAYLATPSARGLKKSVSPPFLKNNACTT